MPHDSLGWCGIRPVIDVLRAWKCISFLGKGMNDRFIEPSGKSVRIAEQKPLEFMDKEVGNEVLFSDVCLQRVFQVLSFFKGILYVRDLNLTWKISREAKKVKHGRYNSGSILSAFSDQLRFDFGISHKPTFTNATGPHQNWVEGYVLPQEITVKQLPHKRFFGLTFAENVNSDHRAGLPPKMFFFQSSPRV